MSTSSLCAVINGRIILLLTPQQLNDLKTHSGDSLLACIDGTYKTAKNCDDDTWYGYVAYGLELPLCGKN